MNEQTQAVKRMQNFICNNLGQNITLADLSNVSYYSPWHSYRLFIKYLNMTPADYIRRYRLSNSALKLRDEKIKIIDVAYEFGFSSVDGYQRAFYKEFGCNPHEYSVCPIPIYLFTPYMVSQDIKKKEKSMEKVNSVFIQVIEKPQRKVLIKRGVKASEYFEYCNEIGCDIWGLLLSMSSDPVCMWLPDKYIKPNTSKYVQGVEVEMDYTGVVPEGFDMIELPACKYLKFQGEQFEEENYQEAISAIWQAIKKFDPSTIGYSWDNDNPRIQLEPRGERGYIELLAVK